MNNRLLTIESACELIRTGSNLLIAGSEDLLGQLPRGNWIGGTTTLFMTEDGCCQSLDRVFATALPDCVLGVETIAYGLDTVDRVTSDAPENGVTFVIAPSFSNVTKYYAENAPDFEGMFIKPIAGWVSGVRTQDIGKVKPAVFLGRTGEKYDDRLVAMQVELSQSVVAKLDIVNLFEPGCGPSITFPEVSFKPNTCFVDGVEMQLVDYYVENQIDITLPLVSNLCGAMINVSIASFDPSKREIALYSPVFPNYEYRLAKPVLDYTSQFVDRVRTHAPSVFTCNCIHNYMYCDLEGKRLGVNGPLTYGEIAYQLLNRTMVYVDFLPKE